MIDKPKIKPQLELVAIYYCGVCAGNAEKSAIMAGYSPKYARGHAYELVAREDVKAYIEYLNDVIDQQAARNIATVADIQEYWTIVMNNAAEATKNRLRASELLAKSKGAFREEW